MNNNAIIVISFEDYKMNMGGTGKAIRSQELVVKSAGYSEVFICPFHLLNKMTDDSRWLIRIDGKLIGVKSIEEVCLYLKKMELAGVYFAGIQIHHMKNVELSELTSILQSINCKIVFYIHDFYSVCPRGNGNLMLDDNNVCDIKNISLDKCKLCVNHTKRHDEIAQLLWKFKDRLTFVAPSDACKSVWIKRYPQYAENVTVLYHQKFKGSYTGNNKLIRDDTFVKIAFVGVPTSTKGWNDFITLVSKLKNTTNYEFFAFGNGTEEVDSVKNIIVDYRQKDKTMTQLLRKHEITVVLLLSKCPETYSYTYYESLAANAFVLAYGGSGNIKDQVLQRKNGHIFNNLDELQSYLENELQVRADINDYRKRKNDIPAQLTENADFITQFDMLDKKNVCIVEKKTLCERLFIISYLFKGQVKRIIRK